MKLTKLTARNIKGLSFTLDLASINFFVGANFAGKSARADAIRLLLIGYLPELGKLPRATFGLCSSREMSVEGEFDNGDRIVRRWYLKGDTVKTENLLPPWLDEEQGAKLTVMLNAETYFALSDRERVNYVFANIPMEGEIQPGQIDERIAKAVLGVEGAKDVHASALITQVRTMAQENEPDDGYNTQGFIDAAIEAAVELAKRSKDYAGRMEKTAQGLSALRAADAPTVDVAKLAARSEALGREIETLQGTRAKFFADLQQEKANTERRQRCGAELSVRESFVAQRDAKQREIETITAKLAGIRNIPQSEIEELRLAERDAAIGLSAARTECETLAESIRRNERELREIDGQTICPYCGASGEGWKALKTAEIKSALAGLAAKHQQAGENVATVKAHAEALNSKHAGAAAAIRERINTEQLLHAAEMGLAASNRQLAALEGKQAEIDAIPVPDPETSIAFRQAEEDLSAKRIEKAGIDGDLKAAAGRAHDLKRLAEAEGERDKGKLEEACAKAAAVELRAVQAEMVAGAFGPLLATANAIFGAVLKSPLAYHDGEIGSWRDGAWVGHRTFSGTEKALCYAAIQAALAARSPIRVMILDELGRLDDANARLCFDGVRDAIDGKRVDQFIGIDTRSRYSPTDEACNIVEIA